MAQFDVTFIANVVVDERITADSQEEARKVAAEMINEGTVGEHGLSLDWEVTDINAVDDEDDNGKPDTGE